MLAISHDGKSVYAADEGGEDIAIFARADDGSLGQAPSPGDCIVDSNIESAECQATATGIGAATGVAVSPAGDRVYTTDRGRGESGRRQRLHDWLRSEQHRR